MSKRDTGVMEKLLGHLTEARKIARKEVEGGAGLQHLYDSLTTGEQHIASRLKELEDWNKAQEKARETGHSPTFEEFTGAGYAPENYPPAGHKEVPSEGLKAFKAKQAETAKAASDLAKSEAKEFKAEEKAHAQQVTAANKEADKQEAADAKSKAAKK